MVWSLLPGDFYTLGGENIAKMKIAQKITDPLTRQANEAVRIGIRKTGELLNIKGEFHHPPVTRITVERTPIGMS